MLSCAQRCQSVLSQPVANPHSRSVAPNRPTFARSAANGDSTTQIRGCAERDRFLRFLCEIELSLKCGEHFADFIFQKCSAPISFSTVCKSSSRYTPVHFFRQLSQIDMPAPAETETLLRRPQKPLCPKVSLVNSHASELLHFPTA